MGADTLMSEDPRNAEPEWPCPELMTMPRGPTGRSAGTVIGAMIHWESADRNGVTIWC